MNPSYQGAPGWGGQADDQSRWSGPLPTSSARPGPPGPSNLAGPPAPTDYGPSSSPYSQQSSYAVNQRGAPGHVPSHPSGQYPQQYEQRYSQPGPGSGHSSQMYSGPASGTAPPPGAYGYPQQLPASGGYPQQPPSQGGYPQQPQSQGGFPQQPGFGQAPAQAQSFASFMNPWSMFNSVTQMGNNMQASQQYVSSRVSWFTGGFFGQLFQVDPDYVGKKLTLLTLPFLRRYDYMRQAENMSASMTTMKPPKDDLFAPDLYIPLHAVFTYVVLSACNRFIAGAFKPEVMYNMFTWASMCWAINFGFVYVLIRMMNLHNPPVALETLAYTGYSFVGYCVSIVVGWLLGRSLGWYTAWLYTSTCMAIFLIQSFKQVIRVDASQQGKSAMYLVLAIGAAQFVVAWVMGATLHAHPATVAQVVPSG